MQMKVEKTAAIAVALLSLTATCASFGEPAWKIEGIPSAAFATSAPLSAVRWIWLSPRCTVHQTVYFRQRFEIEDDATVRLQLRADDIVDGAFLNGIDVRRGNGVSDDAFVKAARPGTNVLALQIRNGTQIAGVLYRVLGRNDEKVFCTSSSSAKCLGEMVKDWYLPDFDDSDWKSAYEHGDVTMPPWSRHSLPFVKSFMTDAEWVGYQQALKTAVAVLPASLASEPEPDAHVVYRGWLPKIEVNGKVMEPNFNLPLAIDFSPYVGSNAIKLDSLGFSIIRVTADDDSFYRGEGDYDFSDLDWQARRILTMVPNARMEINLVLNVMRDWCRKHPDECVGYATGPADPNSGDMLGQKGRVLRPSPASFAFRQEVSRIITSLGAFVHAQPWGKRAIAVRASYGVYTEWHAYSFRQGPDTGVAMTKAFRRYLKKKYGDDAALAKAWNDTSVSFGSAQPPTMEERGPEVDVLDPVKHQKAIDFFDCNANVMADLLIYMGQQVKQALPGRLVGAYYGYILEAISPEGANILVDKVLASPTVDYLTNPPVYSSEHRRAGGAYTMRNIPATYHRYGKLCLCEADMRDHHAYRYEVEVRSFDAGTRTPEESLATAKRNYLNNLFDGIGIQALDLTSGCRPGGFDDPFVLKGFHEAIVETAAAGEVGLESGNELAVVLDYRGRLKLGNRPGGKPCINRYLRAPMMFYRTGMTFDMLTLDDYLASRQAYRRVLFLNPCEADAGLMANARAKAGAAAIGFDTNLGTVEQYRALFERLGLHAWAEPGSYVRHHGGLLMFHTGKSGHHRIVLPGGYSGAKCLSTGYAYEGSEIGLETDVPQTWLFKLNQAEAH